ncbi:uncharacterized protein B0H18DRAFT_1004778 [Fomitopsis serialis]|uniref:uncharacterized protein n=1 Tax=Fomitopsis serialis TaxID=139415 RepID=UPI002008A4C7|nr:uncharacterized protein B0H18DRAFT_1004778 [Neoantrodia serialis]KAH9926975.1 hypothetical protein B0H18DRAFT_1004778 [Neoantrodia serialis]
MRPEFFRALPHFTSLKSLHLSFCKLNSLCQLGRIICAFPQLKHLSLEGWIIADQGSSNHTGVIHLQSWTNIRLQLLQITLDTSHEAEEYKTIIEWIVRSGICNSLEHLMVWAAGSRRLPLTLLLEAAGPSLIHYFEDKFPSRCHGTLIPSTALRFLDFSLHGGVIQGTGKSVDSWLRSRLARELRSVFSTVRSHQLEQVSIKTELPFYGSAHMGPQPQDVAGDPDLRDLHGTMGQPYFDMLKGVKVSVRVLYAWHEGRKLEVDEFDGKVSVPLPPRTCL